ncbi:MAG: ion channel [Lentisphaerae bacterium]|nr:ion channel [Lentisphaerota bacterium]
MGYGDIIPVSHPAQMLSVFEAIIGQLYLTILIARFVGLYIMDNFKNDKISD